MIRRFVSVRGWLQEKYSTRSQESETFSRASAIVDRRGLASLRGTTLYTCTLARIQVASAVGLPQRSRYELQ